MRVRWTDEEKAQLVAAAANLLHTKQVFSLRDSLNKAILTLPKDRRRDLAALTQVPWFTEEVPAKLKELERQQTKTVEQQLDEAVSATAKQARQDLEDQIVQWIAKILAKAIRLAIEDSGLSSLFRQTETIAAVRQRVHAARERLPRVVVAGMLNSQAKTVEAAYKDKLDIRFWSKDQSTDTLKSMLSHADACVGMVSFLSHAHDAVLKSSKVPYQPVSGGVSQMKNALEKLLEPA